MKACAVVIGIGDGSMSRSLVSGYRDVVTIVLPGEQPLPQMPGHQFVVGALEDAAEVVSKRFARHEEIVKLPDTDFYDQHPCSADPAFRHAFCTTFYQQLGERPLWMGDSVTDCLQGAYHMALHAHLLAGAPRPDEIASLDCPVLCIASGPSVQTHLDHIRSLARKCLIIVADSALEPLLAAGIQPDIVTPLERVPEITHESFPAPHYQGIFAGTPAVHHDIAPKFDRHILIPGSDLLFSWFGCDPKHQFFYGQSTGVLACSLALKLSTGKVYLIGHDLCYAGEESHWRACNPAVKTHADSESVPVPGNDGQTKLARHWWNIFRRELGDLAHVSGRVVNVNAHAKIGALIHHALAEPLPDPSILDDKQELSLPAVNQERVTQMLEKLERLPKDAQRMLAKLSGCNLTLADLNIAELCPGPNRDLMAYLLRSVMASVSMDHWTSRPAKQAAEFGAQAMRNVIRANMGVFRVMANSREAACVA